MKNIILIICTSFALILLSACSSEIVRDDAVRIKPERSFRYIRSPHVALRDGSTLRGEVSGIEYVSTPDSCPITPATTYTVKGYVLFMDSLSGKNPENMERIPVEDVDFVGPKTSMPLNKYNNINYFESYNNPLLPKELREVPVDTIFKNPCTTPCPCEKLNAHLPCFFCFDCPDRQLGRFFFELKPSYGMYKDYDGTGGKAGKDDWTADAAFGVRLGSSRRLGIGVMASAGLSSYNSIDSTSYKRAFGALYLRYELKRETRRETKIYSMIDTLVTHDDMVTADTIHGLSEDKCRDSLIIVRCVKPSVLRESASRVIKEYETRPCLSPFVYCFAGCPIDSYSMDIFKLNLNDDCKKKVPNVQPGYPITYGFGIGLEFPLSRKLDLSADLGWRSAAYGDKEVSSGFLTPVDRRLNAIIFRLGITY